jgi:hypothetical protein
MSYANGKVYVDTTVTPYIGVSVYDVQRALGTNECDEGSLCRHDNINKWAKYKPVRLSQRYAVTENGRQSVNYGIINIPTWSYLSKMAAFLFTDNTTTKQNNAPSCGYNNGIIYWDYEKPQGSSGQNPSPYRIMDFSEYPFTASQKGYYHFAQAPVRGMETGEINVTPDGVLQVRFPLGVQNANTLTFADLTLPDMGSRPLSGMWYGILLKQVTGSITNRTYVITQSNTIGELSASYIVFDIPLGSGDANWAGVWHIQPIISSKKIDTLDTNISNHDGNYFVALLPDHLNDITVSIQKAKAEMTNVVAYRVEQSQQPTAYFTVTLKNATRENVSRNYSIYISICDINGNLISDLSNNPRQFTGTLPANGAVDSQTFSILISNLTSTQRANLYYKIRTVITGSVVFTEEDNWYLSGAIPEGSSPPQQ